MLKNFAVKETAKKQITADDVLLNKSDKRRVAEKTQLDLKKIKNKCNCILPLTVTQTGRASLNFSFDKVRMVVKPLLRSNTATIINHETIRNDLDLNLS